MRFANPCIDLSSPMKNGKIHSWLSMVKPPDHRKHNLDRVYRRFVLMTSVVLTGLILGVRQAGVLQPLELAAYDRLVRWRPSPEPDSRLLVVEITESDIQSQNQWPLSDQVVAQLLATLQQYRPKAIGLDLYRDVPNPPGERALREQLQAQNVITIATLGNSGKAEVPSPPEVAEPQVGFNDFVVDPDGVIRRNFMFAALAGERFYSFSLRLSLLYLADQGIDLRVGPQALQLGQTHFVTIDRDSGSYQTIDSSGYQILLNYRPPESVPRQVSLTQVLNGALSPEWVRDKVVLIGTTAPSAKDLFYTPYSSSVGDNLTMPGVVIHAQLTSQILSAVLDQRPLFWYWPQWGEGLWILGWAFLGGVLTWRLKRPIWLGLSGVISLGGLFGIAALAFSQAGWIPLVPPALAFLATGGGILAYHVFYRSFYDPLTGLPNRASFMQALRREIGRSRQSDQASALSVLFLDLDRFKVINESFGHGVGDQLLIAAADRIRTCLPAQSKVARMGGDEFAILLAQGEIRRTAVEVADKLQAALTRPLQVNGRNIVTTVSAGIAHSQSAHPSPQDLVRDAHTAMYKAKASGKARYAVFTTGMRTQVLSRLQLETDLRQAIEQGAFHLQYQPIISLTTGQVAGFEALVRWRRPQQGMVSPGQFIPVAEETGLIIPLGQWILEEACRQMQAWRQQFSLESPPMISVNLSGRQFDQPDLVQQVEATLQKTGLASHALKLEITESMVMDNVESAISLLLRLKALGVHLSIDDFGTGYSSLSYLHRFPIDTMKVDQSFVGQMEAGRDKAEIVKTIITLGHNLGMDVIAEGVETESQLAKLRALHCEYGQGYFFSKPLLPEAVETLLDAAPQW